MQQVAAAVTMLRGDHFYLKKWVAYYGGLFGREACYIVSHGYDETIQDIAEGCNVITIPFAPDPRFEANRWRLLNNLVQGFRHYYKHVVVGDVDELILMDPAQNTNLFQFLNEAPPDQVITPLGLEVVHLPSLETASVAQNILGPRRFVRHAADYSKPCIVSSDARLSRGAHFASHDQLNCPDGLYLFHLKFCDFETYAKVMDHRNEYASSLDMNFRQASVARHWFEGFRGEDAAVFSAFEALDRKPFVMDPIRHAMIESFKPRGDKGMWQTTRENVDGVFELPERFYGLI